MVHTWKRWACLVSVVGLLGCQSLTGKTAGQNLDDAGLASAVKTKLVAERASNLTRVDVDTQHGIVYLTGIVTTEEQKDRAEELAEDVDGVKRVENQLQVERNPS